jgi:hypothetical protein
MATTKKHKRVHPHPQRALNVFYVRYSSMRLRVRVLPHAKDVYTEYADGAKWRMRAELHEGFFQPTVSPLAKYMGTIVLAGNANLDEIIPHEVFHAVMHWKKEVNTDDDEAAAYAIGKLTARIHRKIKYIVF